MAVICKWCDSADTQAQLNTFQCLHCGKSMTAQEANDQLLATVPDDTEE